MEIRLDGKNALVCGSSQGIGKAIAIQFAQMGANVILTARNELMLKDTLSQLHKSSVQNHIYVVSDFFEPEKSLDLIKNSIRNYSAIHILVNNTGGPAPRQLTDSHSDDYIKSFKQHLIMSHLLVQSIVDDMKKKLFGRIINIISIGLKQPIDNLGISNTIRGAMGSWAKTLSRELAPFGITVNNILPGHTQTSRHDDLIKNISDRTGKSISQVKDDIIKLIPAGRLVKPEEIAYLAGFLASEYASMITGVSLPIDGGFLRCL
jgi:3-oxoacyl-[acyl-carrier protein] reductase